MKSSCALLIVVLQLFVAHDAYAQSNSASPARTEKSTSRYVWREVLAAAPWEKSYGFEMFSTKIGLLVIHSKGTWRSRDGKQWTRTPLRNAVNNLAFLDHLPFRNGLIGLGEFTGNIEQFRFRPSVFFSDDFSHWKTLSIRSNLPQRFFYQPFVFQDRVWIVGGEDKDRQYADVWSSADGIRWRKMRDTLPFGPRSRSEIVQLNGWIYLLNNDVWRSRDALNWERVTAAIVPGQQIFGYKAVVFDRQIWLLGCNRDGKFTSSVLRSADGKTWIAHEAPWRERGGIVAAVHQGKVFMTGGKYGGTPNHPVFRYDNDVWVLEKIER